MMRRHERIVGTEGRFLAHKDSHGSAIALLDASTDTPTISCGIIDSRINTIRQGRSGISHDLILYRNERD